MILLIPHLHPVGVLPETDPEVISGSASLSFEKKGGMDKWRIE